MDWDDARGTETKYSVYPHASGGAREQLREQEARAYSPGPSGTLPEPAPI